MSLYKHWLGGKCLARWSEEMGINSPRLAVRERAFVDTNVLAHIVGDSKTGQAVLETLRNADFEIVTFAKCVYELYSIVRGTTKGGPSKRKHPLKDLVSPEINDIAQRLFKTSPDVDPLGNSYY
jgi:predicted nucleic acid-binding protein